MAAVTLYAYSVVFNGVTYTATAGGPHEFDFEYGGQVVNDWLEKPIPIFLALVDREVKVRVRLREVKTLPVLEVKSSLVVNISGKSGGVTATLTFANMVLVNINANQGRATQGFCELHFQHESADGTTIPVS
jgi:hypothetical protein